MTFDLNSKNKITKDNIYNPNCVNRRMRNPISIEESLKELNDDILKNIREDYKKGNNINDIIQHHKTKNPEAISKIYNLIKFEFDEQERFLRNYENIEEVGLFFFPLNQETYTRIIEATLIGIREGTQNFLNRQNAFLLYLSDLSAFCYDSTLRKSVEESVLPLELKLYKEEKIPYSEDIRAGYCGFIFNESRQNFIKKFKNK